MNKFAAMGWVSLSQEDHFQNGCIGKTQMNGGHETFTGPTIEKLIEQIASFVDQDNFKNITLDACEEAGRLEISVYQCEDGSSASEDEVQQWREGKLRLWLADYSFNILSTEKVVLSRNVTDKTLYGAA